MKSLKEGEDLSIDELATTLDLIALKGANGIVYNTLFIS